MAKSKKKVSAIRAEYQKNITRIKRFVRDASKRGYEFDLSGIDLMLPKRVTKAALKKIQQIKPARLYEKATYRDKLSGELFTGEEGRKIERYRATQKGLKTKTEKKTGTYTPTTEAEPSQAPPRISDIVLNNVMDMLDTWTPKGIWSENLAQWKEQDRNIAMNILQGDI